ncbi:MAG: carbon-nitrogen hydrolase family protein [Planctomycetaceae bacterium]
MRIAVVQMDVALGDVERNLAKMLGLLAESRRGGAELTVFPECALSGYCFENVEEARPHAQPVPGPAVERFAAAFREADGFAVFGLLEAEGGADGRLFNAAALVGPQGLIAAYRKTHLPRLGADCFTAKGSGPFAVHEVGGVRVGLNICYDAALPEPARALALAGADLIVLPTNWPTGADCMPEHAINTRAMENGVYFAAADRVGTERGFDFIGKSRICGPRGETLAASTGTEETILYAEIDPARARNKAVERGPGVVALHRLADRRPELYGPLLDPVRE